MHQTHGNEEAYVFLDNIDIFLDNIDIKPSICSNSSYNHFCYKVLMVRHIYVRKHL